MRYLVATVVWLVLSWTVVFDDSRAASARPSYATYQAIPGVTAEEISAIERLKRARASFVFGVNRTTESFLTEENRLDGFTRLLCDRLSGLFGIAFVPHLYGWDELNEKLKGNVIDFTAELSPNPERLQIYFMTDPIIQRTIKVFTNRKAEKLSDIVKERPLRGAFLRGSTTYELVKKSGGYAFEAVFVDSEDEVAPLLEERKVDAYLDESSAEALFEEHEIIRSENFFPLLYSPLSLTTNNPELKPVISVMQKYLKANGAYEITEFYREGIEKYLAYRVNKSLTPEERAYVKQHDTPETAVRLAAEDDNYPMAFYNAKDKEFQGIAFDVLRQVSLLTGLRFKATNGPEIPWPELLDRLEKGEVAMITELLRSKRREGRFLWLDEPYCSDKYALLSRADFPDLDMNQVLYARVGMIAETAYADAFREWFPGNENTRVFINYYDAFIALEKGEIDLLMSTQNLLLSLTNYLEKPGFKANVVFQYTANSDFGINKNEVLLQSILNKAQRYIDMPGLSERWKRKVFDYNSKMLKDVLPFMIVAIALLILGFAAVFILLMKNRRMSRNLEDIVAQRTRELEQASRAKSDFLSRMSHEMRTPMNAIIGMRKIAEASDDVGKLRYCLANIGASSTHLLGLINDILDMSKIEAGKFELSKGPLHLEKMLIKICNLIIDKVEQKKQTLHVVLAKGIHLEYAGDELRLSQVVANLLSNAVKFTPDGGKIVLAVKETLKGDTGCLLHFSVADTGIGMTAEQRSRLFNSFEQADKSIAARFGGTGLGLAISKSIVEKMNGAIWVESEPGKGSTFLFDVELEPVWRQEGVVVGAGTRFSDLEVLAVSGNEEYREYFHEVAEGLGLSCRTAKTAGEAVDRIREAHTAQRPYQAVFIDALLPDGAGVDIVRRLGSAIDGNTVVITSSFLEWSALEASAADVGVHRFLPRPLFPSLLANAVSGVVGHSSELSTEESQAREVPDFSRITVLLAEDVAINQEIFIALLESTGLRIDTADNGLEAVHKFEQQPEKYDLIIMDLQMPVMDGYEATRTIRGMESLKAKTIPIVAMTANAFKEDIDRCLSVGMNDHMPKPIDEAVVFEKIRLFT